ncbi:GNAT family N-acetyltransferase [Salinisphaera sp. LB1]|uniref:GNAT family N-acetyltransferase n=1 Tax=Salinisphaera sp. LB1 TaxID=2183911 RepID=UPI000D7053C1|nr:GNAT family protein [Salinisphaera sp. LB1]AWN16249.1 GNAT family acetyltransferase [Salinisphaera sp. LB1]
MSATINRHGQPIGPALPDWQPPAAPSREAMIGRFCRLEALSLAQHADALYARIAEDDDPAGWTYLGYGPFTCIADYRDWVARMAAGNDPLFFAIIDIQSERPVGVASYLRIDPANGMIEVGHLHFTHRLRRTPAATEAMALMMRRAFELGYRRYEWKCDALNAPSRRAAERLGFQFEGVFRQAVVYNGRSRDTAWFSIIDREWPAIDAALTAWLAPDNFDGRGRQHQPLSIFMPAPAGKAAT